MKEMKNMMGGMTLMMKYPEVKTVGLVRNPVP